MEKVKFFPEEFMKEILRIWEDCNKNKSDVVSIRFQKDEISNLIEEEGLKLPEFEEIAIEIRFFEKKPKIKKFRVRE